MGNLKSKLDLSINIEKCKCKGQIFILHIPKFNKFIIKLKAGYLVPGMTDSCVSLNSEWQSQVDGACHQDMSHRQNIGHQAQECIGVGDAENIKKIRGFFKLHVASKPRLCQSHFLNPPKLSLDFGKPQSPRL